jgi:hypothetical protein
VVQACAGADRHEPGVVGDSSAKPAAKRDQLGITLDLFLPHADTAGNDQHGVWREAIGQGLQPGDRQADRGRLRRLLGDVMAVEANGCLLLVGVTQHLERPGDVDQKRVRRHQRIDRDDLRCVAGAVRRHDILMQPA